MLDRVLNENDLTGTIPSELGKLTGLVGLYVLIVSNLISILIFFVFFFFVDTCESHLPILSDPTDLFVVLGISIVSIDWFSIQLFFLDLHVVASSSVISEL